MDKFSAPSEKRIPIIPRYGIPVDEAYSRFTRAMSKAAHSTIPMGLCIMYVPFMDDEAQELLDKYEKSGDPDIADHLIESLDAARRARSEELTARMNFTYS